MLNASIFTLTNSQVYELGKALFVNITIDLQGTRNAGLGVFDIQGYEPIGNQKIIMTKDGTKEVYTLNVDPSTKYFMTLDEMQTGTYHVIGTLVLE